MKHHVSATRPITITDDGITFAYSVGKGIKDMLTKFDGRGVILLLVRTVVLMPGIEANSIDVAWLAGDEIFDDSPFDEEEQANIRECMAECKADEYVLVAVLSITRAASDEAEEQTHICVASRQFEEGQIALPDPRNN